MKINSQCEKRHHHFDTLIGAFLVVVFGPLYGVEQTVAVIRDTLEGVVYAMVLPRILQKQHLQQEIQVRSQLVRVGICHLADTK